MAAKAPHPKAIEASAKEGGKKGQDLCGMADLGGMHYFCVAMETCKGDKALLQAAMDGANKEVDEDADDRKGGAGHLGKIFMSAGDKALLIMGHCPKANQEKLTLKEWFTKIAEAVGAEISEETEEFMYAESPLDKEKERFPLKMRETAINTSFGLLREKGLVADDDSDDDLGAMYEDAGIEW